MKKIFIMAAITAAFMSSAMAQSYYVTGSIGQSNLSNSVFDTNTDTSYSISGGVQLDKNWAAELGYVSLGQYSSTSLNTSATAESYNLSLVGTYEIAPRISLLGRIGVAATDLNVANDQTYYQTTGFYGVGAQYSLNRNWSTSLEYDQYNTFAGSQTSLSNVSLGLKYKF